MEQVREETLNLFLALLTVLKPPPDMSLSEWADEYRMLSPESSARSGRWRTDMAPYQREVMNAITDPRVQKVIVMSASQIGKTDAFILNAIGYWIHHDPSPILVLQPTITMGETFSKDRLTPMLRDTPVLQGKVNEKDRKAGNKILKKVFPGGRLTIVGANSPTDLSSRPIQRLVADEVDRYPITAGNEGDPLALASTRLTTFWNKKEVYVSTPTTKGLSRIELEFENSTQEIWNTPCPSCGKHQPLLWGQVKFDKEDLDTIHYICIECGVLHSESEWKSEFTKGEYIAQNPSHEVRGFYINALASLISGAGWSGVVKEFILANEELKNGNIELMKTWTNTVMAQTWEEDTEKMEADELLDRLEFYDCQVPQDVIFLTAAVDTQDDRFEVEVVGWGIGKESWGIKYQVIYGDLDQPIIWNDLDKFLQQVFHKEDGAALNIQFTCIDSGGHYTNEVYKFCKPRRHRRIYAIKGMRGAETSLYGRPSKNNPEKAHVFMIGVHTGKTLVYDRLKTVEEGPGYCHFPAEEDKGYDENYFNALTAEELHLTYNKGKAVYMWRPKSKGRRNEALDIRVYNTAAMELCPLNRLLSGENTASAPRATRGRGMRNKGVT